MTPSARPLPPPTSTSADWTRWSTTPVTACSAGAYHASKWALEGLTESLAQEVAHLGIKVTLVEPGPFGTDWGGSSATFAAPIDAYQPIHEAMAAQAAGSGSGDPEAAASALLEIVDAEVPPLRVLFGLMPTQLVKGLYAQRLQTWSDWEGGVAVVQSGQLAAQQLGVVGVGQRLAVQGRREHGGRPLLCVHFTRVVGVRLGCRVGYGSTQQPSTSARLQERDRRVRRVQSVNSSRNSGARICR